MRKDLIASLDKRFGNLIENDLFLISTYLDPFFGPKSFPLDKRNHVKLRLKYHLGLLCPNSTNNNSFDTVAIETNNRSSNFVFHDVESSTINTFDDMDALIKHYSDHVTAKTYENPLLFWKCHEKQFPELAKLAKKFLGVPASSAAVERMFNISGHIFTNRRRKTGIELFQNLVFLKLNEQFLL